MAENIKRRVAAARLAVAFVAAETIAGAAWAQAGSPPPMAQTSAFDAFLKIDSIKGENIVDGSLFHKDFKAGQVPSEKEFHKLEIKSKQFQKVVFNKYYPKVEIDKLFIKGESNDYIKRSEASSFVKGSEADARYIKLSDSVVRGDGSVHTATAAVPTATNNGIALLSLPNLVTVDGLSSSRIRITNTSGGVLTHSACGATGANVIQPGGNIVCDAGPTAQTLQLIGAGADPSVVTLSFSGIVVQGGLASQETVQILIGL